LTLQEASELAQPTVASATALPFGGPELDPLTKEARLE
jgi:hypothetical protein